jgi:hypothetical protein
VERLEDGDDIGATIREPCKQRSSSAGGVEVML